MIRSSFGAMRAILLHVVQRACRACHLRRPKDLRARTRCLRGGEGTTFLERENGIASKEYRCRKADDQERDCRRDRGYDPGADERTV